MNGATEPAVSAPRLLQNVLGGFDGMSILLRPLRAQNVLAEDFHPIEVLLELRKNTETKFGTLRTQLTEHPTYTDPVAGALEGGSPSGGPP